MRLLTTESATVLVVRPCQGVACAITLSHVATRTDPPAAQIDAVSKGIIEQLQRRGFAGTRFWVGSVNQFVESDHDLTDARLYRTLKAVYE